MPRGVYRSEPASKLGRCLMGTTFDFERPVMSMKLPTANSTPFASRSAARATWSDEIAVTVSMGLLQRWKGRGTERWLLVATAFDAVSDRGDGEVEQALTERERRLGGAAGDAVGRQRWRGVAEDEVAGAV